jgi:AraC-like DNA-binding protein
MSPQFYEPHALLKGFVNNIMIHELRYGADEIPPVFEIPPLPEQGLLFYVRDRSNVEDVGAKKVETPSAAIVIGPHTNRHKVMPGRDHLLIQVGFQPGGLYRLLGIPMSELLCRDSFNMVDLIGNEINSVIEKLQEATSLFSMKMIIENFLFTYLPRLKQVLPIDQVLPVMIKERGLLRIDKLASDACLSIRQFERVFQQRIGLTPKHFSRMIRFGQAWIMKEKLPHVSWLTVAHECGYFDQMHLIQDFKEFAGGNPSAIENDIRKSSLRIQTLLHF